MVKSKNFQKKSKSKPKEKSNRFDWPVTVFLLIAIVSITLWAYLPVFNTRAINIDDDAYLYKNHYVQTPSWNSAIKFLTEIAYPSTVRGYYQPFTMISLMSDYYIAGNRIDPVVIHTHTLILHILNASLIFFIILLLFKNKWLAFAVATMFSVHPMTVEVVAWLSERKTSLSALFALTSTLFYLLYSRQLRKIYLFLSLGSYFFALMSKPICLFLPIAFFILDYWPLERNKKMDFYRLFIEKIPHSILMLIFGIITYVSQKNTASVIERLNTETHSGFWSMVHNSIFYFTKFFFPVNLTSSYPVPKPLSFENFTIKIYFVLLVLFLLFLVFSIRKTKAVIAGWSIFIIMIFPIFGAFGISNVISSDKYAYLPNFGIWLIIAWILSLVLNSEVKTTNLRTQKVMIGLFLGIIIISEVLLTRSYLPVWKDTETLYKHMIFKSPNQAILYANLGDYYYKGQKYSDAKPYFQKALEIEPYLYEGLNNMGLCLLKESKFDEAYNYFQKAIQSSNQNKEAISNIAEVYISKGDYKAGLEYAKKQIEKDTTNEILYEAMGRMCYLSGDFLDGESYCSKAIELTPGYYQAHNTFGVVLACQAKNAEAIEELKKVIQINSTYIGAYTNISLIYQKMNNFKESVKYLEQALLIEPNNVNIKSLLRDARTKV